MIVDFQQRKLNRNKEVNGIKFPVADFKLFVMETIASDRYKIQTDKNNLFENLLEFYYNDLEMNPFEKGIYLDEEMLLSDFENWVDYHGYECFDIYLEPMKELV